MNWLKTLFSTLFSSEMTDGEIRDAIRGLEEERRGETPGSDYHQELTRRIERLKAKLTNGD